MRCWGARVLRCWGAAVLGCVGAMLVVGCSNPAPPGSEPAKKPADSQHAGITTPHGDHSPHHGGLVLMNGEVHYEVVLDPSGKHRIWFSDAVREDLPASTAAKVAMVILRKGALDESLELAIDGSGESWVASGRSLAPGEVTVKVSYLLGGQPLEIEIPFTVPTP